MARDEAYRVAERKIEEARCSGGAKNLNLSGMELTELPESLGQLTQLQSLNLSHNQLTALPEIRENGKRGLRCCRKFGRTGNAG